VLLSWLYALVAEGILVAVDRHDQGSPSFCFPTRMPRMIPSRSLWFDPVDEASYLFAHLITGCQTGTARSATRWAGPRGRRGNSDFGTMSVRTRRGSWRSDGHLLGRDDVVGGSRAED